MSLLDNINYDDWPADEFFASKRERHEYVEKIIADGDYPAKKDMLWLSDKTKHFYILLHHAATNRVELLAEIMRKDIQIEELQGKLDDFYREAEA